MVGGSAELLFPNLPLVGGEPLASIMETKAS